MADRNKNTDIFRKKSLERVSSPDNLDRYIKSTTPSLWLLLASVVLILSGILVFAVVGKIDSSSTVGCKVEDGILNAYITENDYEKIKEKSYIDINGKAYSFADVKGPEVAGEESDSFLCDAAGIKNGSWYYMVVCNTDLSDGQYKGKAVFEKISPITFIIN